VKHPDVTLAPFPDMQVVRYTFTERAIHALAALAFLYVLITGLAFWTPSLYWMATMLGGGFLARLLHPWVGIVFAAFMVWMARVWHADMRVTSADRRWRRAMTKYIRNEDSNVPAAGRFNYGQKVFFWAMAWGTLALLVSGLVLWRPDLVPADAAIVRQLAILVHAIGALVTIAAFIVHVYMGVFVVPGSVDAILHGEVSNEWARHHHRLWADEVAARRAGRADR
jgi:formate dehydrogenase subunit gamma